MINVENQVFTEVYNAVITEYPDAFVTSTFVPAPPKFPAVFFSMTDNAVFRNSISSSEMENHAAVEFELEVFSNLTSGKKAQCYDIASVVDEVLAGLNFTRTGLFPVPNLADSTIYRLKGRYRVVVGKDETLYRR